MKLSDLIKGPHGGTCRLDDAENYAAYLSKMAKTQNERQTIERWLSNARAQINEASRQQLSPPAGSNQTKSKIDPFDNACGINLAKLARSIQLPNTKGTAA